MAEGKFCKKCNYSETDHILAHQIKEGAGVYEEMAKKLRKDMIRERFPIICGFLRICDKFE